MLGFAKKRSTQPTFWMHTLRIEMSDLQLLFDNKIDCIIEDQLLSPDQIATFLKVLEKQPEWKEAAIPQVHEHLFETKQKPNHLFLSQYMEMTHGRTEAQYLKQCEEYLKTWNRITTSCGFDPFQVFVKYIKNKFNVTVKFAANQNSNYCPLVVRDLSEEVLPHADYGPFDGKDWVIDKVEKQIAWNIYLTHPGTGGDTIVYDYVWDNDTTVDDSSYGIENLDKPIKVRFSVKPSRVVLFNSRNFHTVLKSSKPRIAIGGLLGLTKDKEVIAWG
jgi:hypothetical protein